MKISATFTLLAAITPAVVGQVQITGSLGQITLYSHTEFGGESIFSTTAPSTCEASVFGLVNATSIEVTQRRVPIQCTFYSGHKCSGQNYTLGAGKHDFKKGPLLVDSYRCAQNGTTTSA